MTRRRASNPWLKKNPLLSLWLSAANAMLGVARGQMSAAVARSAAATAGAARKPAARRRAGSTTRRKRS